MATSSNLKSKQLPTYKYFVEVKSELRFLDRDVVQEFNNSSDNQVKCLFKSLNNDLA